MRKKDEMTQSEKEDAKNKYLIYSFERFIERDLGIKAESVPNEELIKYFSIKISLMQIETLQYYVLRYFKIKYYTISVSGAQFFLGNYSIKIHIFPNQLIFRASRRIGY